MNGRPWTDRDLAYLRRHYTKMATAAIAWNLRRSERAVYAAARELGLSRRWPELTVGRKRTIRRMNAAGHPDGDIARRLKLLRETVGVWRRRLGLPSQAFSQRKRRRVARATRRQLRSAGCASLAELKSEVIRQRARRLGWPEDLRWRAVEMLETLWLLGPQTRRQLVDELEMPWKGTRHSLTSNDPEGSYLAHLQARGLVVRLGRCVDNGRAPYTNTNLYALPVGVAPVRREASRPVPEVFLPKSLRLAADGTSARRKPCPNGKPTTSSPSRRPAGRSAKRTGRR